MSDELHDEIAQMFDELQQRSIEAGGDPVFEWEDGIRWDNKPEGLLDQERHSRDNKNYYQRNAEEIKRKRRERYKNNKK